MFHVLLVLPALGALVAFYGVMAAVILCLPFWIGVGLQVILTAVTERKTWLALPAALGAACAAGYLVWLGELVPLWFLAIYWMTYFLCLWLARWLVGKLRGLVLNWMGRR